MTAIIVFIVRTFVVRYPLVFRQAFSHMVKIADEDDKTLRQLIVVHAALQQLPVDDRLIVSAAFFDAVGGVLHLDIVVSIVFVCQKYVEPNTVTEHGIAQVRFFGRKHDALDFALQ